MILPPSPPNAAGARPATAPIDRNELRRAAVGLEARFLSEMLKAAGLSDTAEGFSGGIGESQFRSFLCDAQADALAQRGTFGLAEMFERALLREEGQ